MFIYELEPLLAVSLPLEQFTDGAQSIHSVTQGHLTRILDGIGPMSFR
jgi:hypothetical protein